MKYEFTQDEYVIKSKAHPNICVLAFKTWYRFCVNKLRRIWTIGGAFARRYATKIRMRKTGTDEVGFVQYKRLQQVTIEHTSSSSPVADNEINTNMVNQLCIRTHSIFLMVCIGQIRDMQLASLNLGKTDFISRVTFRLRVI